MSHYHFFPYLRQGIATKITQQEDYGATSQSGELERAKFNTTVKFNVSKNNGTPLSPTPSVSKAIKLKGPGDVVGINSDMIVKVHPRDWVTNFEPNYLPYIEFYDEDFPWRYTPASPKSTDASRLRPWIMLIVLKEEEFTRLPYTGLLEAITVNSADLPNPEQLWAWAHVHVNDTLSEADPSPSHVKAKLVETITNNPDKGISRIICPRRLEPNVGYHAFLVPVFETGRKAGMNELAGINNTNALTTAWEAGATTDVDLPVYHQWFFKTGNVDFESLVKMLKPKPMPDGTGVRQVDMQVPGDIDIDGTITQQNEVIDLPGVLTHPDFIQGEWNVGNAEEDFTEALRDIINRPDDYKNTVSAGPDPIIAPPIYGRWHAKTSRLDGAVNTNWVHEANLDPRLRMFAGAGAQVVRKNQEEYMHIAWEQVGEILQANKNLSALQMGMEASNTMHEKHVVPASDETLLALSSPVHGKVSYTPASGTAYKAIDDSRVPNDMFSGAFRRMTAPASSLMRSLNATGATTNYDTLVSDVNTLNVALTKPYGVPTGMIPYNIWSPSQLTASYTMGLTTQSSFVPTLPTSSTATPVAGPPSTSASAFAAATSAVHNLISAMPGYSFSNAPSLNISGVRGEIIGQTDPLVSFPAYAGKMINLYDPGSTVSVAPPDLNPIMAAPQYNRQAMYKELVSMSTEWLLPGLNDIAPNSISLLKSSQANLEAFMLGANYEMSRELLWRGFPTDQRGTYFQFFWGYEGSPLSFDSNTDLNPYKDIHPIQQWRSPRYTNNTNWTDIGGNTMRSIGTSDMLVLTIRGELLRSYPGTLVYLRKARHKDGIATKQREVIPQGQTGAANKYPIFFAKVEPDIYFLGFDIDKDTAKGEFGDLNNAGWFFTFEERAGEMQFGADKEEPGAVSVGGASWSNLNWGHILNNNDNGRFIKVDSLDPIIAIGATYSWGSDSASMAHILFQPPFRLNIHANALL